jgi:hypothetical protein
VSQEFEGRLGSHNEAEMFSRRYLSCVYLVFCQPLRRIKLTTKLLMPQALDNEEELRRAV